MNRTMAESNASEHLSPYTNMLSSIVDYGTELIGSAYQASDRGMTDAIVCGVFLKQIVTMADGICTLLVAGSGEPAYMLGRTIFETSLLMEWMLKDDCERRGLRFYVADLRDQRKWANFHQDAASDPEKAVLHIQQIDRVLSSGPLQEVNAEFDSSRTGKYRHYDPDWYALDGVQSIKDLAKRLNRSDVWNVFYSMGSKVVHTTTYTNHIAISNSAIRFIPVRHLTSFAAIWSYVMESILRSYTTITNTYVPSDATKLYEIYVAEWRALFLTPPTFKYQYVTSD